MKHIYEAPAAEVITLEAVEEMALLDKREGDIVDSDTVISSGRPKTGN